MRQERLRVRGRDRSSATRPRSRDTFAQLRGSTQPGMSSRVPPAIPGEAGGSARAQGDAMSTAYVTLWLLTSAYAAPLGYYATGDTCRSAAGQLAVPPAAQILCVPSEVGQPPGAA